MVVQMTWVYLCGFCLLCCGFIMSFWRINAISSPICSSGFFMGSGTIVCPCVSEVIVKDLGKIDRHQTTKYKIKREPCVYFLGCIGCHAAVRTKIIHYCRLNTSSLPAMKSFQRLYHFDLYAHSVIFCTSHIMSVTVVPRTNRPCVNMYAVREQYHNYLILWSQYRNTPYVLHFRTNYKVKLVYICNHIEVE